MRQDLHALFRIGVETVGLYPGVQLRGSIGLIAGTLDAMRGAGALSGFLGPIIRWSFLNIGRVRAPIAASEARIKEALIAYDQGFELLFNRNPPAAICLWFN